MSQAISISTLLRHLWFPTAAACALMVRTEISQAQPNTVEREDTGAVNRRTAQDLFQEATSLLDRVESIAPLQRSADLIEEVERAVRSVEKANPTYPLLPLLRGRLYAVQRRGGDASDILLELIQTREGRDNWRAFRTLGSLFVESYPQLARHHYKTADLLNPGEPSILFGLSVSLIKLGRLKDATKRGQEACIADGYQTTRYVSHLALLFQAAKRWDEAMAEAVRALKLALSEAQAAPGQREPLLMLNAQYLDVINLLQSRLDASIQPKPDDYLALAGYMRERVAVTEKLVDHEALAVLTKGVNAANAEPTTALLEQYAILLATVGKTPEAIAALTRLQKIDPDNATAIEWLARLQP